MVAFEDRGTLRIQRSSCVVLGIILSKRAVQNGEFSRILVTRSRIKKISRSPSSKQC